MTGNSMSTVRKNLLNRKGYSPYCGNEKCTQGLPRTKFNGKQFACSCGWESGFPTDFILEYKHVWKL